MTTVIIYLLIGLLLSVLFRMDDDKYAFTDGTLLIMFLFGWPFILCYMFWRAAVYGFTVKFNGNIIFKWHGFIN